MLKGRKEKGKEKKEEGKGKLRKKKGLAIVLSANPELAWQVPFSLGEEKFALRGREYRVDHRRLYFLKRGLRRVPLLFFQEGDPEPVDFTPKFQETVTFGEDRTFNFTGHHLYLLSQERATGRGIAALARLGEGERGRKLGWVFWLIVIGVIMAVLLLAGPQIAQTLRGMVR